MSDHVSPSPPWDQVSTSMAANSSSPVIPDSAASERSSQIVYTAPPSSRLGSSEGDSFRLSPKDFLHQAKDNEQYYGQQFAHINNLYEFLRAKVKEIETTLEKKRLNHHYF
ncbi:hypothetical protein BDC45DRAFT_574690 [Circinella umbellata]|nr:hypothetical protein BDC45DRAFT_574690 [Circinella umbellata]